MKPIKYSLLNKTQHEQKVNIEEVGYELQDWSVNRSQLPYHQLKEDCKQIKKPIQPTKTSSLNQSKTTQSVLSKSAHPQHSKVNNSFIPKPIVYDLSYCQNSVVHLGPQGVMVQSRAPYIPPVVAECHLCDTKQHIPGDISEYICCSCHQMQKSQPKFGLFICGVCRHQVCYPYNTSDHIQCNICYSVNKVPLSRTLKQKPKHQLNQSQIILSKELREEIQIQNQYPADLATGKCEKQQNLEEF